MKQPAHTATQAPRKRAQHTPKLGATLPTSEQIAQARLGLDEMLVALQTIRRCLDGLPTAECAESVANATEVLGRLHHSTRSSVLGLALGVTPEKAVRRTASGRASKEEERRARELCDLINSRL
jgi:hypothetical protein